MQRAASVRSSSPRAMAPVGQIAAAAAVRAAVRAACGQQDDGVFLLAPPVGENETDETQQRDERRAGGLEPCGIDRQGSLPGEFAPDGPAERLRCGEVLPVGAACRDGRAFRAVRMLPRRRPPRPPGRIPGRARNPPAPPRPFRRPGCRKRRSPPQACFRPGCPPCVRAPCGGCGRRKPVRRIRPRYPQTAFRGAVRRASGRGRVRVWDRSPASRRRGSLPRHGSPGPSSRCCRPSPQREPRFPAPRLWPFSARCLSARKKEGADAFGLHIRSVCAGKGRKNSYICP